MARPPGSFEPISSTPSSKLAKPSFPSPALPFPLLASSVPPTLPLNGSAPADDLNEFGKRVKKEEGEDDAVPGDERPRKFMLHRSLPTGDLFTSAASLTDDDLALLSKVDDTDVISAIPLDPALSEEPTAGPSVPPKLAPPKKTLKDINPVPTRATKPPLPPPKQSAVNLLYYGPFASFAPTYDSTGSTLGYHASTSYRAQKHSLKHWDPLASSSFSPLPLLPSTSTSTAPPPPNDDDDDDSSPLDLDLSEEEKVALEDIGVDPEDAIHGWERMREEMRNWGKLEENGRVIGRLLRMQWERLRGKGGKEGEKEGEKEDDLARSLLAKLTAQIASLPPSALLPAPTSEGENKSIVDTLLPLLLAEATEAEYAGTMDVASRVAVRESALVKKEE